MKLVLPDDIYAEVVSGERVADGVRILDVPAFNGMFNIHDVVSTMESQGNAFAFEVIENGGWSNVSITIFGEHKPKALKLLKEFENLGCVIVSRKSVSLNVGIPPSAERLVLKHIENATNLGVWDAGMILDRTELVKAA